MNLRKYLKLKRQTERLQSEVDKAAGALANLQQQLRKDFGFSSIAEAEKHLKKLERKEHDSEQAFTKAFEQFRHRWDDHATET